MLLRRSKRILILGGSDAQLPIITTANRLGHAVIVCDINEECGGRHHADGFHAISTTDFDGILEVARKENVDGITTYASDPSAQAVAYVGNQLGLPSNPFDSVVTLTRKHEFRRFLQSNGYFTPASKAAQNVEELIAGASSIEGPLLIKPGDSSGSRGMTNLADDDRNPQSLSTAFQRALKFSNCGIVVIESFVERQGYQIAGDGFLVDGELRFRCFANEHFHPEFNPIVPIGESFPCVWDGSSQDDAHATLQSILSRLDMKQGPLNFDFTFLNDGTTFVIEIGPRNGGNLIPEVTKIATGVDMIEYTVRATLGEACEDLKMDPAQGFYSSHVLHVKRPGILRRVTVHPSIKPNIVEQRLYCRPETQFTEYNVQNHRLLGAMILRFDSLEEMLEKVDNLDRFVSVDIDQTEYR